MRNIIITGGELFNKGAFISSWSKLNCKLYSCTEAYDANDCIYEKNRESF